MKVDTIVNKLRQGDKTRIAEIVGCTRQYVTLILTANRPFNTKMAKEIMQVAEKIISQREALKAELQNAAI